MSELLPLLIEALRDELREYGGLLGVLDRQRDIAARGASQELLQIVAAVDRQSAALRRTQERCEALTCDLAAALGRPSGVPGHELVGALPEDYRPLVQALLDENDALHGRVEERVRESHALLCRSVDLLQRVLQSFHPGACAPAQAA